MTVQAIQHKSLKAELLYLIGRASAPMSCAELYEKCELAEEVAKVAKALANLQSDGKIVRVPGDGRARYRLADGVATPAPAGKEGRSKAVQKDDAARLQKPAKPAPAQPDPAAAQAAPLAGIKPDPVHALPKLDIPTLGDPSVKTTDEEIAKGLDLVERRLESERLADAIIARLKRQLAPTMCELEAAAGLDRVSVHIHIEQVDFHLGGL